VCRSRSIPFVRAPVGDRYVMSELLQRGWDLGGETSGHIICLDKLTTGDGIIAALQVLAAMARSGRPLAELKSGMTLFPQHMINVSMARRFDPAASPIVQDAVRAAEHELKGEGRVVLRPSGTEPVVRVMVEGEDDALVMRLTQELADVVRRAAEAA
jgi:phosphoglucosamine mutase